MQLFPNIDTHFYLQIASFISPPTSLDSKVHDHNIAIFVYSVKAFSAVSSIVHPKSPETVTHFFSTSPFWYLPVSHPTILSIPAIFYHVSQFISK